MRTYNSFSSLIEHASLLLLLNILNCINIWGNKERRLEMVLFDSPCPLDFSFAFEFIFKILFVDELILLDFTHESS
jgi:hypothetical protein